MLVWSLDNNLAIAMIWQFLDVGNSNCSNCQYSPYTRSSTSLHWFHFISQSLVIRIVDYRFWDVCMTFLVIVNKNQCYLAPFQFSASQIWILIQCAHSWTYLSITANVWQFISHTQTLSHPFNRHNYLRYFQLVWKFFIVFVHQMIDFLFQKCFE